VRNVKLVDLLLKNKFQYLSWVRIPKNIDLFCLYLFLSINCAFSSVFFYQTSDLNATDELISTATTSSQQWSQHAANTATSSCYDPSNFSERFVKQSKYSSTSCSPETSSCDHGTTAYETTADEWEITR
jgi:hypothetical protein